VRRRPGRVHLDATRTVIGVEPPSRSARPRAARRWTTAFAVCAPRTSNAVRAPCQLGRRDPLRGHTPPVQAFAEADLGEQSTVPCSSLRRAGGSRRIRLERESRITDRFREGAAGARAGAGPARPIDAYLRLNLDCACSFVPWPTLEWWIPKSDGQGPCSGMVIHCPAALNFPSWRARSLLVPFRDTRRTAKWMDWTSSMMV